LPDCPPIHLPVSSTVRLSIHLSIRRRIQNTNPHI
jgi:hypothetical protein